MRSQLHVSAVPLVSELAVRCCFDARRPVRLLLPSTAATTTPDTAGARTASTGSTAPASSALSPLPLPLPPSVATTARSLRIEAKSDGAALIYQ
eukprot:1152663-Pleurochrysis_carterae.AAC.2